MVIKTNIDKVISRVVNRMVPVQMRHEARKILSNLQVKEVKQGNFTIVMLFKRFDSAEYDPHYMGVGASKRMVRDEHNDAIGYNQALVRAVESVITNQFGFVT